MPIRLTSQVFGGLEINYIKAYITILWQHYRKITQQCDRRCHIVSSIWVLLFSFMGWYDQNNTRIWIMDAIFLKQHLLVLHLSAEHGIFLINQAPLLSNWILFLRSRIEYILFCCSQFSLTVTEVWMGGRACPSYLLQTHDDVIKWKYFPRYWPFVRGIHWSRWIPHT